MLAFRAFLVSGQLGTNTLAGMKAGGRLTSTWAALWHPESGAAGGADTPQSGRKAVASGVPPGAAAARPMKEGAGPLGVLLALVENQSARYYANVFEVMKRWMASLAWS